MQFDSSAALDSLATLPPEPPRKPERSAWGALLRGPAAGAAELFSQAVRSGGISGMEESRRAADDPIRQEREKSRQARESMGTGAMDYARDLRPSPGVASKAEEVVFGLSKSLTKAVGLTAAVGGLPGAALFGASEADIAYQDLRRQGVDEATALKVAGVTGAAGAAGVALPLVGSTLPRTLGLYVAGGPGGYVAQQVATREILKTANYAEIARQYDPLDPVGLALSALVPLPFAAWGVRGNLKAGRAAAGLDHIDAAMVHNLTTLADQHAVLQAAGELATVPIPRRAVPAVEVPPPTPDFGALSPVMRAARQSFDDMTATGQTLDIFLAGRAELDDATRNMLIGMQDAAADPRRADALTRALVREGQQSGKNAVDATADAVESMRAMTDEQLRGDTATAPAGTDPLMASVQGRVREIEQMQPALPVRLDEDGQTVTVADELAQARRAAAEGSDVELGTLDADLVRVAAECALTFGA